MRTGNAFFSLTFRLQDQPECRLTLLDAGTEAVVEISIADAPWEESAGASAEAMSTFRTEVAELPETLEPVARGDALRVVAALEIAGRTSRFVAGYGAPEDLPPAHRVFFRALGTLARSALVGARSRRAVEALEAWL